MKLFIPSVGTRLEVLKDAQVSIVVEHRNMSLVEEMFPGVYDYRPSYDSDTPPAVLLKGDPVENLAFTKSLLSQKKNGLRIEGDNLVFTYQLKASSVLVVDRVYVRKGSSSEFDSLSFHIEGEKKRFWIKLEDVNRLTVRKLSSKKETRKKAKDGDLVRLACGTIGFFDSKNWYPFDYSLHRAYPKDGTPMHNIVKSSVDNTWRITKTISFRRERHATSFIISHVSEN